MQKDSANVGVHGENSKTNHKDCEKHNEKCEKQQMRRTPVYKYSKMLRCEFPKGIASIAPKLRDGQSAIS
jgi:hypothetical protein